MHGSFGTEILWKIFLCTENCLCPIDFFFFFFFFFMLWKLWQTFCTLKLWKTLRLENCGAVYVF